MCGIWCSIGLTPRPESLDTIAHRGPDGRGWQELASPRGHVALGHRRLAIIDTTDDALQPMSYGGGRYWLVFNGEIYNYLELRRELEKEGFAFRTASDSEVLLAAYARWGDDCLDRLWGMFAFVIVDTREWRLFAARDRFGIKPLYFAQTPSGLAFASEIKQLAGLPGLSGRMNRQRAWDFLAGGLFDHTDETLFDGVRQLRGGECAELDLASPRAGTSLAIRRWYRLPEPGSLTLGFEEASARFGELLDDAVRLHLRADVRVGSCLSGGLDSSAIVCLAQRRLAALGSNDPMHTVSACYDTARVDERPFIEAVVRETGVRSHLVFPREDELVSVLDRMTHHQDEPFGSTSIFAQWAVFERARREGIKVMLDGQGADEQLAGYHGMFGAYLDGLARRGRWLALLRTVRARAQWHGVGWRDQLRPVLRDLLPGWVRPIAARLGAAAADGGSGWLEGEAWTGCDRTRSPFEAALARDDLGSASSLGQLCRAHVAATNLPMLLHYEDRSSMAHGVEARVPFLDHRVVELSIALGDEHKMEGAETKRILRRATRGILPEAVRQRRDKLGFATPEAEWFRGPLRGFVEAGLDETLRRFPECFDRDGVRALASGMLEGRREVDFTLWRIVSLGAWGRVFGVGL